MTEEEPKKEWDIFHIIASIIVTMLFLGFIVAITVYTIDSSHVNVKECFQGDKDSCLSPREFECKQLCDPKPYFFSNGGTFSADNCVCGET